MLDEKVTAAQHRIEQVFHDTHGKCYVSFSGGKDSTVLLALIKQCEELGTAWDIPAVFSNTGIELGVTTEFVKWVKRSGWYPKVEIITPEVSFDWVLKNEGKPIVSKLKSEFIERYHRNPTQNVMDNLVTGVSKSGKKARTRLADKDMHMLHDGFRIHASKKCCDFLKKKPFNKYEKENEIKGSMSGIRVSEGGARELNAFNRMREGSLCTVVKRNGFIQKYPLIDWTDDDIEEFISAYNVPLSRAYTEFGFKRTGCMGCPYSRNIAEDLHYLHEHEPHRYKASMHWLKDVYIAQNISLPFDEAYELDREKMWESTYEPMRQEMLRKYRPESRLLKRHEQLSLLDE